MKMNPPSFWCLPMPQLGILNDFVISRGFVYLRESEELIRGIETEAVAAVDAVAALPGYDLGRIKGEIKRRVEDFIWKKIQRNPVVLATLIEV